MEEILSEARRLVGCHFPQIEQIARQKALFLAQREPKFTLIEGLKLLSLCIEIDSCRSNACDHNSESLSVEVLLFKNNILCPSLPYVVPDGFKLKGNVLILLECFVRSNPANFQQKYTEDLTKLESLRVDLSKAGVQLIPIVDGKTSFYTSIVPDWVCERFRHLLFKLLEFEQESSSEFEESEYQRLCESLSQSTSRLSGVDSLNILADHRSGHYEHIIKKCHAGINSALPAREIRERVTMIFQTFRNRLRSQTIKHHFAKVNPTLLLKSFTELYESELSNAVDTMESIRSEFCTVSPIIKFLYMKIPEGSARGGEAQTDKPNTLICGLRSMLNKVKSMKVLNTRRKMLLLFDAFILMAHVRFFKERSLYAEAEWLGSSFCSVNDRLVSLDETIQSLIKWVRARQRNHSKKMPECVTPTLNQVFQDMIKNTYKKIESALEYVRMKPESYGVSLDALEVDIEELIAFRKDGIQPTMSYEPSQAKETPYDIEVMNTQSDDDFRVLSSLCLSIVNSMKTSSVPKLRQNEVGASRYKVVRCREAFYQDLNTQVGCFKLLYQKTGESSKCFAINDEKSGEVCSFCADPKRYFLPIFSHEVLPETIRTMMGWLDGCGSLDGPLADIHWLTKAIVVLILCQPSKRSQRFLQNLRYFVMAMVSEYHHVKLIEKLKEPLITKCEFYLYRLIRKLDGPLFDPSVKSLLTNRFKYMLNVSYFCHLITKETPDRLTDQIKCFEKFLEPKIDFGSCSTNPSDVITDDELDTLSYGLDQFLAKPDISEGMSIAHGKPGVNKEIFSLMVSSFNAGLLFKESEVRGDFIDPLVSSGCATALDLASNKSVVVNKFTKDGRVLEYDMNKLTSAAVCELAETFSKKGKYLLNKDDYDYKVQRVISKLVTKGAAGSERKEEADLDVDDIFEGESKEFFNCVKQRVNSILANYQSEMKSQDVQSHQASLSDLSEFVSDPVKQRLIMSELSTHMVEDFDPNLLSKSFYEEFCRSVHDSALKERYFYNTSLGPCPISLISKSVASRFYEAGEYFQCFKSLLLQMGGNRFSGKFMHHKHNNVNFKFDHSKLLDDVRISERESNSEALSKALSLSNCTSAALKNLCFYSEESPQSFTSVGPNTGRLKFSLSYKEQVGGNRELYIGDLRTKMYTRLIEDYFEAFTKHFRGSCLNDEKEFENALIAMRLSVSLAQLSYSLDHSKWGPMMCPFLFLMLVQNIDLKSPSALEGIKSRDLISTLLCWHIHKIVEVPYNVVSAMMRSYIKRNLGIMNSDHMTATEAFIFNEFEIGVVPSHISSILDMGQGILHNTSDFYGLITEKLINYCLRLVSDGSVGSYTSSDDQISLFDSDLTSLHDKGDEDFLCILEFHNYLSDMLNKFISPKSVVGRFVAEFKSRFFVWGEEVPLLTKFVSASLHNVKCKEPHQLAETIDTIIDQSVANGVPVKLCNMIQDRTLALLRYAKYPLDPFLLFNKSDVKDWVDGTRGYRIMRNIENMCPEQTGKIRSMLRLLYNKLKVGELHEEFTAVYLSSEPKESINKLMTLVDKELLTDDDLSLCWLNLSTYHPLRMVLRQKVIYPSVVNVEEEKVPTIIKTMQNKLSSHFTRGAQKLLSEAINKSAFQSSIASGFVGLCRTLGSKCVRDSIRGVHYIKSILEQLATINSVSHDQINGWDVWRVPNHSLSTDDSGLDWVLTLLRPILWDYLCIALSTALEIGPWVLGDPKPKFEVKIRNRRSCDYFLLRPPNTRILEDKVSMNHLIHSIRRMYPEMFEKHLLPYMSDLAATKMKWSPRVKFLDLCVVLDVNCEALSLISHVVKWKRSEHYVVLMSELQESHERQHVTLLDERVVSTENVSDNFIKQILFESFIRPVVITSRTLGSFTWFPHKSAIPQGEGMGRLGPLSSFVEKVIFKGIERPMYEYDLSSGFSWIDVDVKPSVITAAELTRLKITEASVFDDFWDFWNFVLQNSNEGFRVMKTIHVVVRSKGGSGGKSFHIHLQFNGLVDPLKMEVTMTLSEASYSGNVDLIFLESIWTLISTDPNFSSNCVSWYFSTETISDAIQGGAQMLGDLVLVDVGLDRESLKLSGIEFKRVGPDWEPVPLVLKDGYLWEGERKLAPLTAELHTDDLKVFIQELHDEYEQLLLESLACLINTQLTQRVSLIYVDVIDALEKICGDARSVFILTKVMSQVDAWVDFKGYSICYSKSRGELMKQTPGGSLRLKGRLCEPLIQVTADVEEID
uniref:RNA-directed RNA polymerase L n=1 Tax=Mammarenavirus wenzhouense TaxID=3052330 RepID=A0A8F5W4L0_9VIRU|nr:RNA-dependent RNA polymerase [Mammarenavirus wenzhouense]